MSTSSEPSTFDSPLVARRGLPRMQEVGLVVVILILAILLSIFGSMNVTGRYSNTFLNLDNLLNGVATEMSIYAIMAIGVTLVIISGGIDISVGSIFALSALGTAAVLQYFPTDASPWLIVPLSFAVAIGIGTACGLVNGALIVGLRLHPFVVTLGTMSIFRGIANASRQGKPSTIPSGDTVLPDAFTIDFMQFDFGASLRLAPMLVMLVCVLAGWFYLQLTVAGRENYAVGGNEEAARFSGLRVGRIKLRVYALCGMAAGVAGMVSVGRFGTASTNTGSGYELTVIAAAVVGGASLTGGRGTALGALLGALIIGLITNGIFILRRQEFSLIIIGAAIIVAVAIDRLSEDFRNKRLAGKH